MNFINENEPSLSDFKASVKKWLRDNELSTTWLASNIGKAEGTVKNWLYNPTINITVMNKNEIRRIQRQHESGGDGLRYPNESDMNMLAGYVFNNSECSGQFESGIDDPRDYLADWLICAGTPIHDNDNNDRELSNEQLVTLATWVTTSVMTQTKQTIMEEQDKLRRSDKKLDVLLCPKDGKGKINTSRFNNGYNSSYDVIAMDGIALPVLMYKWNAYYLEVAASIDKVPTPQFVIESLNKAVADMSTKNLEQFLGDDFSTPISPFPKKVFADDDSPF